MFDTQWLQINQLRNTIISHRLETVRQADWVVVLDEGRVVAQGEHQSLYKRSLLYRELFAETAVAESEVV